MYVILGMMLLIIIICICIAVADSNRFVIRHYCIKNKKITGKHRYVFLSDLHNKEYGKENQKLLDAIDFISPEAILVGGDLLVAKPGVDFTPAATFVQKLSQKYPVYYANGNHEYRIRLYKAKYPDMYVRYEEKLTQAGVHRLLNANIELPDSNIVLYGLDMKRKYYRRFKKRKMSSKYLPKALGELKEEKFSVLLAHNPEYLEEYAVYGADLVLSGHVHGGVADLPFLGGVISPSYKIFPEYDGGFFREGKTSMILSRGLGVHTIPIRFMNPGELIVLDLCQE